ncbi:hypothetical protein DVB37_22860 [Achromobacter sp. B7]|uniref:hypothetical protein n=1 Tax=Achromobacter sp. B7 TaxID=2282475 RepID=UPI000E71AF16|nr:hypothetical protein [Achromobacter sp. B7]AYD66441.1 hypothetical protein DVB37_22860 [Achromobacter sp. B7]
MAYIFGPDRCTRSGASVELFDHLVSAYLTSGISGFQPKVLMPDVVTTSVYEIDDPQSGRKLSDRTLALKLNKSREYPSRKTLLQFGRTVCGVARPETVIDRIATAMHEVLEDEKHRVDADFLARMRAEWQQGSDSVQAPVYFQGKPGA